MKLVDLLYSRYGIVSVADCFIGDDPGIASELIARYAVDYVDTSMKGWFSIDLDLEDRDFTKGTLCLYDGGVGDWIYKMSIELLFDSYPQETINEIKTFIGEMNSDDLFSVVSSSDGMKISNSLQLISIDYSVGGRIYIVVEQPYLDIGNFDLRNQIATYRTISKLIREG